MRAALVTVALLATTAGCAGQGELFGQPFTVSVDGESHLIEASGPLDPETRLPATKEFDAVYTSYFPSVLPVHAGDTAFFRVESRGEPHTITMGTLVDDAAAAIDALGDDATLPEIEALPEMEALPTAVGDRPDARGAPEINGSAADPCYLERGSPPVSPRGGAPRCAPRDRDRVDFNGAQTFYSSGLLGERTIFELKVSGDTEPGDYQVMCLIHRSAMRATVEVRADGESLPSTGDFAERADDERDGVASRLREAAVAAWTVVDPTKAVAGVGAPGVAGYVAAFPEEDLTITAGKTVSWAFNGMHSITFDAPDAATDGPFERDDGRWRVNREAWKPVGAARLPADALRYGAGIAAVTVDGGTYDGTGELHSGIIRSLPPAVVTYTLRFTKPGTYSYSCVIHPVMTGTVTVQ